MGARVLTLEPKDVEDIQLLATTLHCAAAKLAMDRGDHSVMSQQLRCRLEEFRRARKPTAFVDAVHHFIEVFYVHCGNRRLDRSMLAIQGQQLILRNLYAEHGVDQEADSADFERICKGVESGDSNEVYLAIRANAARLEKSVIASLEKA